MAFSARNLDPGSSPSAPCAIKVKGGLEWQGINLVIGDQATDEYDSGFQAVPTSDTVLTVVRLYIVSLFLFNGSDEPRTVTVQNGASAVKLYDQIALQPRTAYPLALGGSEVLGLRWQANLSGVWGSVKGYQ